MPQITTIIPTYRRPKSLRRAIQSLLNQTYTDFQICVYDNASDDETSVLVAEFAKQDNRVKYYCHSQNIGAIANFNFGMSRVETPYFSFLSDDDIVLPNFYKTTLAGFAKYPNTIFSAGETIEMTEDGKVVKAPLHSWYRDGSFEPPEGLYEMIRVKQPIWTGILFRQTIIEQFGLLDTSLTINDFDLELRLGARFPFVVSRELCAIFVLQSTSISVATGTSFLYNGYPGSVLNMQTDERIPLEIRTEAVARLTTFLKRLTFRSALFLLSQQNYDEARKLIFLLSAHYGLQERAYFLQGLAWLFERIGFLPQILAQIYRVRQARAARRNQPLQDKFGWAARYLDL